MTREAFLSLMGVWLIQDLGYDLQPDELEFLLTKVESHMVPPGRFLERKDFPHLTDYEFAVHYNGIRVNEWTR